MGVRDTVVDLGSKGLDSVHRLVLRASWHRLGGRAFEMSAAVLRVVGRRSGIVRSTMLTGQVEFDGPLVMVATTGVTTMTPTDSAASWPLRWSRSRDALRHGPRALARRPSPRVNVAGRGSSRRMVTTRAIDVEPNASYRW